jgi:hypothetical protein
LSDGQLETVELSIWIRLELGSKLRLLRDLQLEKHDSPRNATLVGIKMNSSVEQL